VKTIVCTVFNVFSSCTDDFRYIGTDNSATPEPIQLYGVSDDLYILILQLDCMALCIAPVVVILHSKNSYFSRKQEGKYVFLFLLHRQGKIATIVIPGLVSRNDTVYFTVSVTLNVDRLQVTPKFDNLQSPVTGVISAAE
jgi:hypothetical protein